jgi:tRNA-dihydrouridine synthase A
VKKHNTAKLSVAPMMDCTDRHCRYLLRLLSPSSLLYTEMVTTGAILHGDYARFLSFHPAEHPVALQLGGSDPAALAECAKIGEAWSYDEVNLNVGCPSPKVQSGRFGACLMLEPDLVARCVAAMQAQVAIPVTVKTRIGVDEQDSYPALQQFITTLAASGCQQFIMHARKAWLKGLNPKQNRTIPPIRYDVVRQLKIDFPHLSFILNGEITNTQQVENLLQEFDGVMIGRAVYDNPYWLGQLDQQFLNGPAVPDREFILQQYLAYVTTQLAQNVPIGILLRPLIGLFQGKPHAKLWRRYLTDPKLRAANDEQIITVALTQMKKHSD